MSGPAHRRISNHPGGYWLAGCLVIAFFLLSSTGPCFSMPRPPQDAIAERQGNVVVYTGTVYVCAHEDTAKLKELGFRDFEFEGRSFSSLKYKAKWPISVADLPVPEYVTGINYELSRPDRPYDLDALIDNSGASPYYGSIGHHSSYDPPPSPRSASVVCRSRRG
jgi:hypothetical protein